jgi:hypothetical protein
MSTVLKKVEGWPFAFGGEEHSGWLPPEAVTPRPTPVERELLDVQIESTDGGYLLTWAARSSPTCRDSLPPKTGDTWHETIEDAEAPARDAFGIEHEHWTDIRPTA